MLIFGCPYSNAKPFLLKAIEIDATNYEAWYNLATAYFDAGEFRKCLVHCDAALKIRCTYEAALDLKKKVLQKLSDLDDKAHRLSLVFPLKEMQDASFEKRGFIMKMQCELENRTDESEDEAGKDPNSDDESEWEDEQEEEDSVLKGTMEVDIEAE